MTPLRQSYGHAADTRREGEPWDVQRIARRCSFSQSRSGSARGGAPTQCRAHRSHRRTTCDQSSGRSVTPPAQLMAPTRGKAFGALKGAGGGFATGAKPGLYLAAAAGSGCVGGGREAATLCALVIMTGLGAAAAGGTVGALGGTVYGLVTADSASTIAAAESALTRAVADVDVQRSLRDHVLREVGERSSLTFVDLEERTAADGAPADHRRWKHDGIDTVLEVTMSPLRLAGGGGVKPRSEEHTSE